MINRRNLILAGLGFSSFPSLVSAKKISKSAHIVIVGAGWGGLSFAKTMRYLDKNCKITIIEKNKQFISCPISNWVIGQVKGMEDITFSFENLGKFYDIELLNDEVKFINYSKKTLHLKDNVINFDKLVLSPGIEFNYNSIEGLSNAYDGNKVLSAWRAGNETSVFSNNIKKLGDGENIIISIPLSPYRCPPGPYERASLIADHIKSKKLRSKVIVLDANQKIISKGNLFEKAWHKYYKDIIYYYPDSKVISINAETKTVFTDFDSYKYDIANIIPQQKCSSLLETSELVEKNKKWAKVNPYNFSSIYTDNVYIIGDSTDRSSVGAVPKSGYIAYSMGKVAAFSVYYSLLEKDSPSPSMINTCYSLVSKNKGISVTSIYEYSKERNKIVSVKNASGLSPNSSALIADNAWDWAQAIWSDMLS